MTELSNLTADLIRFKSTKEHPEEIKKCLQYIKTYFKDCNIKINEFEDGQKPSLFITTKNTKTPAIVFNGHIDVVEGKDEQFTPKEKDGNLYGRGAVDMKGGVAVIMAITKYFAQQKNAPDIGVMIVADEELDGMHGTNYQINQGYGGKFFIDPEPNQSKNPKGLDITIAHKGVLWVKLIAKGKAAHGSRPWLGDNAADKLISGYQAIKALFTTPTPDNQWVNTMNLGVIAAGNSPNRIPDYAEMILDIRFTENSNPKKLLDSIKKVSGLEVEIVDLAEMLSTDENLPLILQLKKIVESHTKQPCGLLKEHGSSDMRFTSAAQMPSIILGPKGENYHGNDEYVNIASLDQLYAIFKTFVETANVV